MILARIVLADDHEIVRNGLRAILAASPGFEVCALAENGQEAVDRVRELRPDLVILDLSMPVLNGLQAAAKIRKLSPAIGILIFSAHDEQTMKVAALAAGADAYLSKSALDGELVSTIRSIIAAHNGKP